MLLSVTFPDMTENHILNALTKVNDSSIYAPVKLAILNVCRFSWFRFKFFEVSREEVWFLNTKPQNMLKTSTKLLTLKLYNCIQQLAYCCSRAVLNALGGSVKKADWVCTKQIGQIEYAQNKYYNDAGNL